MDSNGYLWGTGSSIYRPYIIPSTNTFTQVQQLQIESDIEKKLPAKINYKNGKLTILLDNKLTDKPYD